MSYRTFIVYAVAGALGAALLTACNSGVTPNPFRLCGNDVIDPGEQCDLGDMNSDNGACPTTCQTAFCGDGWLYVGKEECDRNNFGDPPKTCKSLGFDSGTLRCTASCGVDVSGCGPAFTPTATATVTPTAAVTQTPTATPTPGPMCGNGLFESGETCTDCPGDCSVRPCNPSASMATFTLDFTPPPGQNASSVTVVVGYRSDVVSIPGSGTGSCMGGSNDGTACGRDADCSGGQCLIPRSRTKNLPSGAISGVNDLDYAIRVVVTRSSLIPAGRLFTADFDTCTSATVTSSDVACSIEGCASSFGPIEGCKCTVSGP